MGTLGQVPLAGQGRRTVRDSWPHYDKTCYPCPCNARANGKNNPNYLSAYAFENDFAALQMEAGNEQICEGLLQAKAEEGICKVVCFSPRHDLTLPLMSQIGIQDVIRLWMKEYQDIGQLPNINHVQIFEDKGEIMGCSDPHPHGQIWAQQSIPQETAKKGKH